MSMTYLLLVELTFLIRGKSKPIVNCNHDVYSIMVMKSNLAQHIHFFNNKKNRPSASIEGGAWLTHLPFEYAKAPQIVLRSFEGEADLLNNVVLLISSMKFRCSIVPFMHGWNNSPISLSLKQHVLQSQLA